MPADAFLRLESLTVSNGDNPQMKVIWRGALVVESNALLLRKDRADVYHPEHRLVSSRSKGQAKAVSL